LLQQKLQVEAKADTLRLPVGFPADQLDGAQVERGRRALFFQPAIERGTSRRAGHNARAWLSPRGSAACCGRICAVVAPAAILPVVRWPGITAGRHSAVRMPRSALPP